MTAIHLDGKANKWYDNFCLNKIDIPWPYFCDNVCSRFENPAHDNIVGLFNKLARQNTVDVYFEEFEYYKALLLSVHKDFPETYFIASFIGGLKEELRSSVLMFDPKTLLHAFSLARMQAKTLKSTFVPSTSSTTNLVPKPIQTLPIKKLTPEEVQARKAHGLCFNCDEAYNRGDICKKQYLCVLIGEEAEEIYEPGGEPEHDTDEEPPLESDMEISLHALTGNISGDTIRIPGFVKKKAISILIDNGSTHSFIDSALAASLHCSIAQTGNLLVTVANGDKTVSSGVCSQLEWTMQGHKFCGDLRLLPLGGCDIVLGAYWLRNLGDVQFNLSKLCITFKHNGKKITLTGVPQKSSLSMMSGYAVKKQKHTHGIVGQLFSITSSPVQLTTLPPFANLLTEFSDVSLKNLVKEMLHSGIIQPSHSPFASLILLVKKKDNYWRFCVDYRKLNSITIKDKFPIPVIDELLDELHGSKFFTKIDLKSGYHQIIVSPSDIHKIAFRTHHRHFEFKVMSFGLTNAPTTFQALMSNIFQEHIRKFILVFFDDILVYSPTLEDHLLHLQTTLELPRLHQLTTNFSKCSFGQSKIKYLGHISTGNGVMGDPEKIYAMVDWPTHTNLKALRGFLGLTGYYRKFVQNYGIISIPLTELLEKDAFSWSPAATTTFLQLKNAMTTTPVLVLPDFSKQFILETDVCDLGIGVFLMQEGRAIYFYSKPLGPRAASLSTYEKELLAIVQAVTKWKHYLQVNYADDPKAQHLIAQLTITPHTTPHYSYINGVLRYKNRLYVGSSSTTKSKILNSLHCSAFGGHSGMQATYIRAKSYLFWPAMKKDILLYDSTCDVCQRNKGEHTFPNGLLQPLPIPNHAWQHISMDFIEGLPMNERKSVILVVVDRLTKYRHFIGLHHPRTASSIAREFISQVLKLDGLPSSIVSGRDNIFTSNFWQDLFKALGTQLHLSTAYHPQTDGETERVNSFLEIYLRCMCHQPKKWNLWLPLAEWWYNTNYHTILKMCPFQAFYGYLLPHLAFPSTATTSITEVESYLKQRDVVLLLLKDTLHKS
ncbi:uncharacterized protein LOC113279266 [Papaver somniferum]|uniref:uncharacterized protein LOC113279266 n=1 Tax=Papaver somniferum TaxID=3469 RepID=UPI000E70349E|nr:uncharacterized protein LOC113279266 [Papaver somniferum]